MLVNQSSENPSSFLDPDLSWKKQIKPMMKGVRHYSLETMNFEESDLLDFPEASSSSSYASSIVAFSSPPSSISSVSHIKNDNGNGSGNLGRRRAYKQRESFSSGSFSLCTEGLGFESIDDVEDLLRSDIFGNKEYLFEEQGKTISGSIEGNNCESLWGESLRSRSSCGSVSATFPPPISSIGKSGKPLVCFKSIRKDGRFILREIRIPTSKLLQTSRENGRLKMKLLCFEEDDDDEDNEEIEAVSGESMENE